MQSDVWQAVSHPDEIWPAVKSGFSAYFNTENKFDGLTPSDFLPLVLCVALTCDAKVDYIAQVTKLSPGIQH